MMLSTAIHQLIKGHPRVPGEPFYRLAGVHGIMDVHASIGDAYLVKELRRLFAEYPDEIGRPRLELHEPGAPASPGAVAQLRITEIDL
jgi:hypothetical protein